MIVPFVWWQSRHDHHAHAFPAAQATEPNWHVFEALCHHTVTPNTVIRRYTGDP